MDSSELASKRLLTVEHSANQDSWVCGRCCYAVYECGIYKLGFEPVWPDQDMVWMHGLAKQIGYANTNKGAPFIGCHWHLNKDEIYAVAKCLDARDSYLYDEEVSISRQIINLPEPKRYQDGRQMVAAENELQRTGPSIWVPDE